MEEKYYIVNQNGEVIDETLGDEVFTKLRTGDIVLKREGIIEKDKLVRANMQFGKINTSVLYEIGSKFPLFLKLTDIVQYQTGKLVYNNGVNVNRKNLIKWSGFSKNTIDRQIKGLIAQDVIKSVKDGRNVVYFMNPYVIHVGKMIYKSLDEMFKDTIYKKNVAKTTGGVKNE